MSDSFNDIAEYQNLIKTVVWRMAGTALTTADIHDVVQDVNLRLLDPDRSPEFDPTRGAKSALIGSMARSMAIDALRRRGRMIPISDLTYQGDDGSESSCEDSIDALHQADPLHEIQNDAISTMLREEQRDELSNIIKQLSPDDQHFILICVRDDYDNDAYAERLGVKPVALRVRKTRLADKLKQMLVRSRD